MALAVTQVESGVMGDLRYNVCDVTFSGTYPTGGESLTAAHLNMSQAVYLVLAEPQDGYLFLYDHTNSLLMAYYFDYNAVADGAAIEFPTGALAISGVRVFALGY